MKYTLILAVVMLASCGEVKDRHELTSSWIATHKKPISTYKYKAEYNGSYYTLIDADGNIYYTGGTYFTFPPIIDSTVNKPK